jgi:hypothetical protein
MKKLALAAAIGLSALSTSPVLANLLSNGDFETAALTADDQFLIGSVFGQWITYAGQYALATSGPSGSATDDYAKHNVQGGGGDQKLVQFVSGAGIDAGSLLSLSFAYIYDPSLNASFSTGARISIVGISADRNYQMYGGTGTDGIFNASGDFGVAAPDVLLAQSTLAFTNGAWLTSQLTSAATSGSFFAFGIVVQSACFDPVAADCNNLRGFDNVSLNRVPTPGAVALLGAGVLGMALAGAAPRRRRA